MAMLNMRQATSRWVVRDVSTVQNSRHEAQSARRGVITRRTMFGLLTGATTMGTAVAVPARQIGLLERIHPLCPQCRCELVVPHNVYRHGAMTASELVAPMTTDIPCACGLHHTAIFYREVHG